MKSNQKIRKAVISSFFPRRVSSRLLLLRNVQQEIESDRLDPIAKRQLEAFIQGAETSGGNFSNARACDQRRREAREDIMFLRDAFENIARQE